MAAEAIIRRCLGGTAPSAGARPALRELEIGDYEEMFKRRAIHTGSRVPSRAEPSVTLYRRLLGDAWDLLSEPIRNMHNVCGSMTASGIAQVERGDGWVARLVASAFRFPRAGKDVPVEVRFDVKGDKQVWTRKFRDRSFSSIHEEGRGAFDRLLCERFGPFVFGLALVIDGDQLHLVVRRWTCFGIPLPVSISPRGNSYESGDDGRFRFHVEIGHPALGLIIRYRGWLIADVRAV
jgi:hypothetical protein